jgi:hypothetical protein
LESGDIFSWKNNFRYVECDGNHIHGTRVTSGSGSNANLEGNCSLIHSGAQAPSSPDPRPPARE